MSIDPKRRQRLKQRGLTLIELVIFIVIVSVALAGVLTVLNITVIHSADPLIRKQMLAVAEAVLEEVQLQPFTYCDPTDEKAATAASAILGVGGCATLVENLGTPGDESSQTRTSPTSPFNNVNDYSGYVFASPITGITGTSEAAGYNATITIDAGTVGTPISLGPASNLVTSDGTAANMRLIRIAVTVSRGSDSLTLEGYRTRYSPNTLP